MDLAAEVSEPPRSASEKVERALWDEGEHEEQIGNGQVHDEGVGRCAQRLELGQDADHHPVASDGYHS